jgi:hypothetical protein
MSQSLEAFVNRWVASGAAERANKDSFLNELCDVLGVARPNPAVGDLVAKGAAEWTVADVAAAFKGAKKADVEDVLDSLAALGILAAFETRKTRRWKPTRHE